MLIIKYQIEDILTEMSSIELNKFSKKYADNAVILFFVSLIDESVLIYWKSKNIGHFLKFRPHKEDSYENYSPLYEFIKNFLAKSLINDHLGMCCDYS